MEKKYYTKYILKEGEPIMGTICYIKSQNRYTTYNEYGWREWLAYESGQVVQDIFACELCLCSNDIKIGDTFRSIFYDKDFIAAIPPTVSSDGIQPLDCFFTYDGVKIRWVPYKEAYKIIGKISSEDNWVEEGMVFEEEEFQKWITFNGQPLEYIEGHMNYDEGSMFIKFKCPTCKKFH